VLVAAVGGGNEEPDLARNREDAREEYFFRTDSAHSGHGEENDEQGNAHERAV
jgi:hypothetical protein